MHERQLQKTPLARGPRDNSHQTPPQKKWLLKKLTSAAVSTAVVKMQRGAAVDDVARELVVAATAKLQQPARDVIKRAALDKQNRSAGDPSD